MENLRKMLMVMLCAIVAFSIMSCLGEDDDTKTVNPLTNEQRAAQVRAMAGTYTGLLYFVNDSTQATDSINVVWYVSAPDSSLTFNDFPAFALAQGVGNVKMSQVVGNAGPQSLRSTISPYVNTVEQEGYYTFTIIPDELKMEFDTEYEGATHHIKIGFTTQIDSYISAYGQVARYYPTGEFYKNKMLGYILIKSIEMDGYTVTTNRPTYFLGTKY